jgi:hypothetical protein
MPISMEKYAIDRLGSGVTRGNKDSIHLGAPWGGNDVTTHQSRQWPKVAPRVSCLCNTFAALLLADGYDIRTRCSSCWVIATTMTYLHVLNRGGLGVRSPADRLGLSRPPTVRRRSNPRDEDGPAGEDT